MRLFAAYLKEKRIICILLVVFLVIYSISFLLFQLPYRIIVYTTLLCLFVGCVILTIDFMKFYQRYYALKQQKTLPMDIAKLPEATNPLEAAYQELLILLAEEQNRLTTDSQQRYFDMIDYYTVWVHQIKTPIASMRLMLQEQDSELCRELKIELQKVEQYVDMVLCYLRLDGESTDYVLAEYDLDGIVKQAVKRMASQFIGKKITLNYAPLSTNVLTDEKWLLFVIEQVLSNALKYTKEGTICISMEKPQTLCISDTGIGIAPEDLPRIFEKGFTGFNGREDKKASGIGLYLCRRICKNLGHRITAESILDEGTTIRIYLEREALEVE